MEGIMINILIVDDEKEIADLLEIYLKNDNFNVYKYYSSIKVIKDLEKLNIDLAVLDVMMPDMDGFELCNKIREKYNFPIIFLTAKVENIDKIKGLTIGADDYVTKPFEPLELVARIKSQLRRWCQYSYQKDWNLLLVNKWNKIPDNYEPNLVEVPGGEMVDERIYEPLMKILEDAREENWGELPMIVSGYRTNEKQQQLYKDKIKNYKNKGYSEEKAKEEAEKWVAVPGYSEHQLGFAVDINGVTYDLYFWLQENSYKYGFIFRYPGNKTDITGTAEEVWHYRYGGKEVAKEIYDKGIC